MVVGDRRLRFGRFTPAGVACVCVCVACVAAGHATYHCNAKWCVIKRPRQRDPFMVLGWTTITLFSSARGNQGQGALGVHTLINTVQATERAFGARIGSRSRVGRPQGVKLLSAIKERARRAPMVTL